MTLKEAIAIVRRGRKEIKWMFQEKFNDYITALDMVLEAAQKQALSDVRKAIGGNL